MPKKWARIYDATIKAEDEKAERLQQRKKDALVNAAVEMKKRQGVLTPEQEEGIRIDLQEVQDRGKLEISSVHMSLKEAIERNKEIGNPFESKGRLPLTMREFEEWSKYPEGILLLLLNHVDPDELKEKIKKDEEQRKKEANRKALEILTRKQVMKEMAEKEKTRQLEEKRPEEMLPKTETKSSSSKAVPVYRTATRQIATKAMVKKVENKAEQQEEPKQVVEVKEEPPSQTKCGNYCARWKKDSIKCTNGGTCQKKPKHKDECLCQAHRQEEWKHQSAIKIEEDLKRLASQEKRDEVKLTERENRDEPRREKKVPVNEKWIRSQSLAIARSCSIAPGKSATAKKEVILESRRKKEKKEGKKEKKEKDTRHERSRSPSPPKRKKVLKVSLSPSPMPSVKRTTRLSPASVSPIRVKRRKHQKSASTERQRTRVPKGRPEKPRTPPRRTKEEESDSTEKSASSRCDRRCLRCVKGKLCVLARGHKVPDRCMCRFCKKKEKEKRLGETPWRKSQPQTTRKVQVETPKPERKAESSTVKKEIRSKASMMRRRSSSSSEPVKKRKNFRCHKKGCDVCMNNYRCWKNRQHPGKCVCYRCIDTHEFEEYRKSRTNAQGKYERDSEEDEPMIKKFVEGSKSESRPAVKMVQGEELTDKQLREALRPPKGRTGGLGRLKSCPQMNCGSNRFVELEKDEQCQRCNKNTFVLCYQHCLCCYCCHNETDEEEESLPEAWKREEKSESEKEPRSYDDLLCIEIPVKSPDDSEILESLKELEQRIKKGEADVLEVVEFQRNEVHNFELVSTRYKVRMLQNDGSSGSHDNPSRPWKR